MRLLGPSVLAVLALGAMSGNAAAAKKVLVLKEEGKPVAVNAELQVELEQAPQCILAWRAHMAVNSAKAAKIAVEPLEQSCETLELYPEYFRGRTDEVEISTTGKSRIGGSWRQRHEIRETGAECTNQFEQLRGKLATPGTTQMPVSARYRLVEESGHHGRAQCRKHGTTTNIATLRGHNGKPLEAEVVG